jgi:hypothetical protein
MNNHKKIEESLIDFALGQLPVGQSKELLNHIKQCRQCSEQLQKVRNLLNLTEQISSTEIPHNLCLKSKNKLLRTIGMQNENTSLRLTWRNIMNNPIAKLAAAAVIIIAAAAAIAVWNANSNSKDIIAGDDTTTEIQTVDENPENRTITATADSLLEEQLKKAEQLFAAADVDGLIQMLDEGQYEAKVAAANYLAQLGDVTALPALESLAAEYADPANPFAQAATQLQDASSETTPGPSEANALQIEPVAVSTEIFELLPHDTLFCVRINNLDYSLGQMDQYLSGLSPIPMAATTMVRMQLAQMLADPAMVNVDTANDFAVFGAILPGAEGNKTEDLFIGIIIPMKDYDKFITENSNCTSPDANGVSTITSGSKKHLISKLGTFAIIPLSGDYNQLRSMITFLAEKKETIAGALSTAQQKSAKENALWAYCSVRHSAKLFGPVAYEKLKQLEKIIEQQQQGQSSVPPKALGIYRAMLDIIIDELDYTSLSISPSNDILSLQITSRAIPETLLARMFTSGNTLQKQNKLLAYLPDGAVFNVAMKMNTPFWEELSLTDFDLMLLMSEKEVSDQTAEKIEQLVFDMISACGGNGVASLNPVSDSNDLGFGLEYIVEVSDPEKWIKTNEEIMKTWAQGGFQDIYSDSFGIDIDYAIQRAVEEYKGVKIDSAFFALKTTDPNSEYGQLISSVYGEGIDYRWATTKGLYVCAVGGDCRTRIQKLIDSVQNNGPAQIQPEINEALRLLPESDKCDFLGTLNYLRMLSLSSSFMPQPISEAFKQIDLTSSSNIIFGGRLADGYENLHIIIPKKHIMEIYNAVQKINPIIMQAQNQTSPPAQSEDSQNDETASTED